MSMKYVEGDISLSLSAENEIRCILFYITPIVIFSSVVHLSKIVCNSRSLMKSHQFYIYLAL